MDRNDMWKCIIVNLLILLLLATPAYGYPAAVDRVIDGDTVVLTSGVHIRLAGIDCPEHDQPYGTEATEETQRLCMAHIDVREVSHDRYGRTIAWLNIIQSDGAKPYSICSINSILVYDGLAWHYTKYDHNPELDCAQADARHNHRGLWQDASPIPPWVWRHHAKP